MSIPTYDEFVKVQAPAIAEAYQQKHGHPLGVTDMAHNLYRLLGEGWTFANVIHGIKDEPLDGGRPQGPEQPKPQPAPGPAPTPAPGPTPEQSVAYVAAVKRQLEAEGADLRGACGAFAITKCVAWGLRNQGAGLLAKQGGNNCEGYATDIVAFHDRAYDILSDGGGTNGPLWGETGVDDLAARWRPPVEP